MRQALSETWLVFPVEVWPNIGASLAAGLTDEQRLDIGEPNIVGRLIAAACGRVAALVVRAVDQHAPNAHFAKLAECEFLFAGEAMSP